MSFIVSLVFRRRTMLDDGRGVDEPLKEPGRFGRGLITRGKHWILVSCTFVGVLYGRRTVQRS